MGEFSVLLDSSEPLEGWDKYVDEMVSVLGKTRYDVARAVRSARGIVFDSLDPRQAERAISALARMGRAARMIETSHIPPLDPVYTIRNADCTPEGLMIQIGYTAKLKSLPWREVRLISACSVRRTKIRREAPRRGIKVRLGLTGPTVTMTRGRERTRKEEFEEGLCDVFTLDPVLHIRINSRGFNYDYLAERLTSAASGNFFLLVSDLVRMSPNARLAADASTFAEGNYPPEPLDVSEFDAINRHALAVLSLGQ